MANQKMGFEGLLYYGAAGSTAGTLLTNCKDITIDGPVERGDTTVRGDGSAPPVKTSQVTSVSGNIEFVMLNDSSDASLEALKTAAAAGTPVALRGKDYASGKGPDADYNLSVSKPWPLNGEQVVTFSGEPERSSRVPLLYV